MHEFPIAPQTWRIGWADHHGAHDIIGSCLFCAIRWCLRRLRPLLWNIRIRTQVLHPRLAKKGMQAISLGRHWVSDHCLRHRSSWPFAAPKQRRGHWCNWQQLVTWLLASSMVVVGLRVALRTLFDSSWELTPKFEIFVKHPVARQQCGGSEAVMIRIVGWDSFVNLFLFVISWSQVRI